MLMRNCETIFLALLAIVLFKCEQHKNQIKRKYMPKYGLWRKLWIAGELIRCRICGGEDNAVKEGGRENGRQQRRSDEGNTTIDREPKNKMLNMNLKKKLRMFTYIAYTHIVLQYIR